MNNLADRLLKAVEEKQNPSVVGLDPRLEQIPKFIKDDMITNFGSGFEAAAQSIIAFNRKIINAVKDIVPAVKPQIAFYEKYLAPGIKAFNETVKYAKSQGLLVIGDCKRNDIGSTAEAYSQAHLGKVDLFGEKMSGFDLDCITVNPYLGIDGVRPFIEDIKEHGKGIFVLVKTSNPSSGDFQDLVSDGRKIYEVVGDLVNKWNQDVIGERGYGSVGAVVGATYPEQAAMLRRVMPKSIFLVPGYGAQGGGADDTVPCFNSDGHGAIVNSSRGIIFAYEKEGRDDFDIAAHEAALEMKKDLNKALGKAGIRAW